MATPACRRAAATLALTTFVLVVGNAAHGQAAPPAPTPPSRGQLLYTTHCIACHNTQMHWRDRKLAKDWPSLRAQVQRWQAQAQLGWSDADVNEVARYLNDAIYGYPQTSGRLSLGNAPAPPSGRVHSRSSRV